MNESIQAIKRFNHEFTGAFIVFSFFWSVFYMVASVVAAWNGVEL